MKNILILGAGKSATVLIEYLLQHAEQNNWRITLGDLDAALAAKKLNGHPRGRGVYFNSDDTELRDKHIQESDIVISLLPAFLHPAIAAACVACKKHFVSASYVSDAMQKLDAEAKAAGVILMNEIGLDPGIDHMSAKKLIDAIVASGGEIHAFESYTGGLIAPESDTNPWNYKFTWNPRNVVLAGQGTAKFLWNGTYKYIPYHQLFSRYTILNVPGYGAFEGYPNRDSLGYRNIYGLENASTIIRGTLRKRGFCDAWDVFVQLGLTDDTYLIEGIETFTWKDLTRSFLPDTELPVQDALAAYLSIPHRTDLLDKLEWLGIFSDEKIDLQKATPAQALQKLLESKWSLQPGDKDMCVMLHRMHYSLQGKRYLLQSEMVAVGEDEVHTAMAKTVGLPAAITTKLILNGSIQQRGVIIPVTKDIYEPVLAELHNDFGIGFSETQTEL